MKMKKVSKVLEGAMAQAVFDVSMVGDKCWLKDCLMLQILKAEKSRGYIRLAASLKEWQIRQLKLRLERFAYRRGVDNVAAAKFYKEYLVELARRFGSEQHITTELALIDILQDKRTISSRLCAMYDKGSNKIRS
jgi:ATP-dependent Clp protease ATP-binding subunit ClpC